MCVSLFPISLSIIIETWYNFFKSKSEKFQTFLLSHEFVICRINLGLWKLKISCWF